MTEEMTRTLNTVGDRDPSMFSAFEMLLDRARCEDMWGQGTGPVPP